MKKMILVMAGLSGFGLAGMIFILVSMLANPQESEPVASVATNLTEPNGHAGHGVEMGQILNEREFLEHMIPHHEEAVMTSRHMLGRITKAEHGEFLQAIIDDQTLEIEQLKAWYLAWYGVEFQDGGVYEPMMPALEEITDDSSAWNAYLGGMIDHHEGAVEMATTLLNLEPRRELSSMAVTIIRVQNEEIAQMRAWLQE